MTQAVLTVEDLPTNAVEAASHFHAQYIPLVQQELAGEPAAIALVLPAATIDHDDWRRSIVRDLARAHAPVRINMIGGDDKAAITAMLAYLRDAPGITGQYLPAHD